MIKPKIEISSTPKNPSKPIRSVIFVSTKNLAAHEFHKLLRVIRKLDGFDVVEILDRLHQRKAALSKSMGTLLGTAVLLYFATPTSDTAFSINTPYLKIEIPRVMAVLLTSFCWCFGILSYISYSMYDRYILVVKSSLYRRASWPLLDRLYDADGAWIDPINVQWNFFKTGKMQTVLIAVSLMAVLIPIILIGYLILTVSTAFLFAGLFNGSLTGNDKAAAMSAILLFVFPLLYAALLLIPFPVKKNRAYVRWNFLSSIWRPLHRIHPTSGIWLAREKHKE